MNNYIERLSEYSEKFKKLVKTNPEKAREIAKNSLFRIGIIDESGKLKPPYNGVVVNESDFTRGPRK